LRAPAQSEEIFGFLPFAARVAAALAFLSAVFARLRSFFACFAGLVEACSIRLAARSSFFVTLAGTWPAHRGLVRPASTAQRALVHGSVVVVVVAGNEVVVVVAGRVLVVVGIVVVVAGNEVVVVVAGGVVVVVDNDVDFSHTCVPGRINAPGPGRPAVVLMVLAVVDGSQKTDTTVPVPILG